MATFDASFADKMDKVVKQIYTHCDPNNTDLVPLPVLIEFVKQFMPDNPEETETLRAQLDPEDRNPNISSETFTQVMESWAASLKEKYSEESNTSFDNLMIPGEELAFNQSTPRSSLGYQQLVKSCSELFNMSNISTYFSNNLDSTVSCHEKSTLEDEIRELQHQLHKLKSDLDLSKQQLAATEEHNEYLQADLQKITKTHQTKLDAIIGQLKEAKMETERHKEDVSELQKRIKTIEKEKTALVKEIEKIQNEYHNLENEKANLEKKLEKSRKLERESRAECEELGLELRERDAELYAQIKVADDLKNQLEIEKDLVAFYANENALAKQKTLAAERLYEKLMAEKQQENNILHELVENHHDSPVHNPLSTFQLYNSPRFLHQISNPVDPNFNSERVENRNSLYKAALMNSCSTPTLTKNFVDKDESPLLSPIEKLCKSNSTFVLHAQKNTIPMKIVECSLDDLPETCGDNCENGDNVKEHPILVDTFSQTEEIDEIATVMKKISDLETEKTFQTRVKTNLEELWTENTITIGKCEKVIVSIFNKVNTFAQAENLKENCGLLLAVTQLDKITDHVLNQLKVLCESKRFHCEMLEKREVEVDDLKQTIRNLEENLDEQIIDNMKIQELERELKEKNERIAKLTKQIRMEEVVSFMITSNTDLRRTTSNILTRVQSPFREDSGDLLMLEEPPVNEYSTLEKEMHYLGGNIKTVMKLLEMMAEQFSHLRSNVTKNCAVQKRDKRSRFGIVVQFSVKFLLVLILLGVSLLCYAQWECRKDGTWKDCPLDALLEEFVEKRYTGVM